MRDAYTLHPKAEIVFSPCGPWTMIRLADGTLAVSISVASTLLLPEYLLQVLEQNALDTGNNLGSTNHLITYVAKYLHVMQDSIASQTDCIGL